MFRFPPIPPFLVCLLLSAGVFAQVGQPPDIIDLQTSAYMAIMRGDQARDADQLPEATTAYQDALKGYQRIQQADANFKAQIIDYRISYCNNQIRDLQTRMAKQENPELLSARSALKEMQMRYQALASDAEALRKQSMSSREREQAALEREAQASAKAAEALAQSQKLTQALGKLAEEKSALEKKFSTEGMDRPQLLDAVKAAELRGVALEGELAAALKAMEDARHERGMLQKELDTRATLESEQARMAGQTRQELEATRKRVQELESEWAALGASPREIQERIVQQEAMRSRLEEESVARARENEQLKAELAALSAGAPSPEAMAAVRGEFEKKLAESMQHGDELGENLRQASVELEAMRQARRLAEEQANIQAGVASNALVRIEALASESLGWSNRVQEVSLDLGDSRDMLRAVEARSSASLQEQQARATEAVRSIEKNIAWVKGLEMENGEITRQLHASENLRAELENMNKSSRDSLAHMDAIQQSLAQAQLEIDGLKNGLAAREAEVKSFSDGEGEFRKTIGELRGMLTRREQELQSMKDRSVAAPGDPPVPPAPEPGTGAAPDAPAAPPGANPAKEPPLPRPYPPVKRTSKSNEKHPAPPAGENGDGGS